MDNKIVVAIILIAIIFVAYKINWYIKQISPVINNLSKSNELRYEPKHSIPNIEHVAVRKENSTPPPNSNVDPQYQTISREPYELYMGSHEYMKSHPNRNFLVTPPGMNPPERANNYCYPKNKEGLIDVSRITNNEPVGVLDELASAYDDTMENGVVKKDNILYQHNNPHNITSESCVNKQIKQRGCADIGSCGIPAPLSTRRVSY